MQAFLVKRTLVPAILAGVLLASCSSTPQATRGSIGSAPPSSSGTQVSGGTSIGSCVEPYNKTTLGHRKWAFDGTVKSSSKATTETGADSIAFGVNHWYRGGSASEITVKTYGLGAITSAGSIEGKTGDRMLVTGDDDSSIWTCGFTQPFTDQAARDWSSVFGSFKRS